MIEAKILDIRPGDVPRKRSWQRAIRDFPNSSIDRLDGNVIDLSHTNMKVGRSPVYGLVTVEGSHRLARILQLAGQEAQVRIPLTTDDDTVLDDNVKGARRRGIKTFNDFLSIAEPWLKSS